ncbi:MAG: CarD family transcriptional regulator [Butyrivibrio sp.]|nr:CarD family transcriptional regulator [Acetatifactor muris]MCM1559391.1 CarD family transcriptional regulator [Butyrivibrio sp.]
MFEIGEYVVCGNKGVCVVENITTLDIAGVDKERKYYILKPKYQLGSTVYVPVDSTKDSMRRIIRREEAQKLIDTITDVPLLAITNEKLSEQIYRECLKSGNCEEWVRILKTIWRRKQERLRAGRKETAVDARYFHMAEESLYGELAVALDLKREEVEAYIEKAVSREPSHEPA